MKRWPRLRARLRKALQAGGITLGVISLFGFLTGYSALADQCCHWRVQYIVILVLFALLFAARRRFRAALLFAAFAVPNILTVWPYLPKPAPTVAADVPRLRLLHSNVYIDNNQHGKVKALVAAENPDIISMCELSDQWLSWLQPLNERYPNHAVARYGDGEFAIGFWSRYPIRTLEDRSFGNRGMLIVEADAPGGPLTFIVAHPDSPGHVSAVAPRDRHLRAVGERVASIGHRVIVVGDLNTTPFSHGYQELIRVSGLRDASRDLGILPTWPVQIPIMLIPLDHILTTPDLTVLSHRRGRRVRSDHYPVVAEIALGTASSPGTTKAAWDAKMPNPKSRP